MVIFDKRKYVIEIMNNGIKENDSRANTKLFLVAKYLNEKTTYKPGVIKKRLKKYSEEYFRGMPVEMIDKEIDSLYNRAKTSTVVDGKRQQSIDGVKDGGEYQDNRNAGLDSIECFKPKKIHLYANELKKISELDEKLQELAFAFLVVNKFLGYKWTPECNSDIYKICHWDKAGNGKSQTVKNDMIHSLVNHGIIRFYCDTNSGYKYNKKWIAKTFFTVLINEDNFSEDETKSPVWRTVTNYDDVMLYWRLYKGDLSVKLCKECNAPIEDTGNSKRYCSDCAMKRIRESKKRNKSRVKMAG